MNEQGGIRARISVGEVTVEIEATSPEELEEVVRRVVSAIGGGAQRAAKKSEGRRATTCRDILERLLSEGWFSPPRSLGDVTAELARRGYFYDPTAVAHGLLDLVREEKLMREGAPRRYHYRATAAPEGGGGEGRHTYLFRVKCPYCGSEQSSESLVAVTCEACGASYDAGKGGEATRVVGVVKQPGRTEKEQGVGGSHHDSQSAITG